MLPISRKSSSRERGATLAGYALLTALFAVPSIAVIENIENESSEFIETSGDQIGDAGETREERLDRIGAGELDDDDTGDSSATEDTESDTGTPAPDPVLTLTAADATFGGEFQFEDGVLFTENGIKSGTGYDPSLGIATFTFTVTTAGYYHANGIVGGDNGSDNSFFIIHDGDREIWGFDGNGSMTDTKVNTRFQSGGSPREFFFEEGEVQLLVAIREDGARLESLEIEYLEDR